MAEQQPPTEKDALKLLIVEDDADLAQSLSMYMKLEGYAVTVVGTAGKCYVETDRMQFDLTILDLSLPDQDGLVLARYLRSNTRTLVLMLSARSTIDDRKMGYEAGAHLYIAKPVDLAELATSIATLISATSESLQAESRSDGEQEGGWSLLRLENELVSPSGERTHLTTKEWELLKLLSESCNAAVPRKKLMTELEYPNTEYGHRALEGGSAQEADDGAGIPQHRIRTPRP